MPRRYRPTNPLNRGFKERTIVEELASHLRSAHDIEIVHNRQIEGGASSRRPDALIDRGAYAIIVEIDERQHRSQGYARPKTLQRVEDLRADLQGRSLVLIRFNPDSYKCGRQSYRSLFSKTRGDRIYKIGCPHKFEERMDALKALVSRYVLEAPTAEFEEHKLFFDGYVL